ncbi:MAG: zinc metalloprotease HtpX [Desulfovibrionaceae bacterium]
MTSQIKTFLLLALLSGLILFLGGALGGPGGLMVALVFALVMNVGSYWFSAKIVLSMYRAREVGPHDAPALHAMVAELARTANIPKPRICVIPQDAPNAFATGRNPQNGVVAVTEGIMRLLTPEELKGVLAHEIGHIAHRDILIQTVAGVLASVVMFIANMLQWGALFGGMRGDDEDGPGMFGALALALVAPIAASLIQMAISRSREYLADDAGAQFSHNPLHLASALRKLDAYSRQLPMRGGNEATAHMFIVHPFTTSRMASLFSTHPPIAERVARLEAMARNR